jgi:hypothetical protein
MLLVAILSASYACAAMLPAASALAHPCCPRSDNPSSANCEKIGCLSTAPVIRSVRIEVTTNSSVVGAVAHSEVNSLPERATETALGPPQELYVIHHRFLI